MAWTFTVISECLLWSLYVTAINVSFELVENDVNEVIFVDEKDIVVRCYASGLSGDFLMRIEHESKGEIARTTNETCLEHTINQVSLLERGSYTCIVSYFNHRGRFIENETKSLFLNVQDKTPQCFRNGTKGEPYQDGDLLLLSCYCLNRMQGCVWSSTVPGSGKGEWLNYTRTEHHNKYILRILVKNNSTYVSSKNRYDCSYGRSVGCSIGPQYKSSRDTIVNSPAGHFRKALPGCMLLSTPDLPIDTTQYLISTQTIFQKSIPSETGLNVAIFGRTVGLVFFIVIILAIIAMVSRKYRKDEKSRSVRRQVQRPPDDQGFNNDAHSEDNAYQIRDENHHDSGFSEVYCSINSTIGETSGIYHDLSLSDQGGLESTGDYAELDDTKSFQLSASLQNGSEILNENASQNARDHDDVTPVEIPGQPNAPVTKEANDDDNVDILYAKVEKYRTKNKMAGACFNIPEGYNEDDASALYAKVEKDKRNLPIKMEENIELGNNNASEIYAEIGKN